MDVVQSVTGQRARVHTQQLTTGEVSALCFSTKDSASSLVKNRCAVFQLRFKPSVQNGVVQQVCDTIARESCGQISLE